jgi:transposase
MHPKTEQPPRRVHDAQFKAKVLAQCREPGVSVASVALANGLNANLIRKWQVGRGLKRSGLTMPATAPVPRATPPMQFVPVNLAIAGCGAGTAAADAVAGVTEAASIHVELRCGSASLTVQWPRSQLESCSAWLSELAGAVLKR